VELFEAIEQHDADRLTRLLRGGADPNILMDSPPFWRPLHAAIEELEHGGPIDALILLLRAGADPGAWDDDRDATPLLMACFRQQREAVRLLLGTGATPNVIGSEGDSPLRWWVELGDQDMVALLLRCGATPDSDAMGLDGMTTLGLAAHRLDVSILELLIAYGADPHATDADYRTARERLPPHDPDRLTAWEAAAALLNSDPHHD
jgi:ankyrin repeat protein